MTGPRRRATGVVAVSGSLTVPRAISDAGLRRDLPAGCDGGQGDHLHRVVAEANPLEGDAVDGAMVFTDAAVRTAVVVDQDLAGLSAEFLPEHGVADLDEAAARGIAVFTGDNHVQRLLGADVVAGATEDAGRLIDVVDRVALEAAQRRGDRLLVVPRQLHRRHVHPLLGWKDGGLFAQVIVRLAVVVGRFDDGQRLGVARDRSAEELVDRARRSVAPGDGIDDERWALGTVAPREQLRQLCMRAGIGLPPLARVPRPRPGLPG